MLTIRDCIDLCQLTEGEVAAIAGHEHAADAIALEMGNYLCINADGEHRLSCMIIKDIEKARVHDNLAHAAKLRLVLQHFLERHARVALTDEQKGITARSDDP